MIHRKRVVATQDSMREIDSVAVDASDEAAEKDVQLNWEEEVLRRIAPRLAEVQQRAAQGDDTLGWEAAGLRRLAQSTGQY